MFKRLPLSLIIILVSTLMTGVQISPAADINNLARDPYTGMEFVSVPGGCFTAGGSDGNSDEKPPHEVCLSSFHIGKYEVTQGEWQRVMGFNPSLFTRCGNDCPVEQVSWTDAKEFIYRLNRLTGRNYHLPTEAQWEYACRGGNKGEKQCGRGLDSIAWYDRNSSGKTHPVGTKIPNSLGIFDMSGNVWEWVQDWSGRYPAERSTDPVGPTAGSSRVRRGGSWQYDGAKARATWRSSGYQDDRAMDIGFRLAHPLETGKNK